MSNPAAGQSSSTTDWGMIARLAITVVLLLGCGWWLWVVSQNLSVRTEVGPDGVIVIDQFQRAKDVLLAVLPLLTLALGYWFGTQGTAKAEEKAEEATAEAKGARDRIEAIVAASSDTDLLSKARSQNPRAFGEVR